MSSLIGGFFVYLVAQKNVRFAWLAGVLLLFDLVWGTLTCSILTDGIFAMLSLLAISLLLFHYDRRLEISYKELVLSGFL